MGNPLDGIEHIERITDPAERAREVGRRLDAIPTYQERLRAIRQAAVLEMKAADMSYAAIGKEIGLHRNRVQQIAEGRTGSGQGGTSNLPAAIREFKDGRTATNPGGRTWYEVVVDSPDSGITDVLQRADLNKNIYFTPEGDRTRLKTTSRVTILRVHDVLVAAGHHIVAAPEPAS